MNPELAKPAVSAKHILEGALLHLEPFAKSRANVVDAGLAVFHEYIMTTDADEAVELPGCAAASVLSFPLVQTEKSELQRIFSQSELILTVVLGGGVPVSHISVQ